jgi:hypothetical protein
MASEMRTAIQRTLILTLGEAGTAVGERLTQMLTEWEAPSVVAVRDLANDDGHKDVIAAGLRDVSRLTHRAELHRLGYRPDRLDELVVWVVGEPGAPMVGVASLVSEQAVALLGTEPLLLGLVVCAGLDASDAALPTEAEPGKRIPAAFPFTGPCFLVMPVNETGLTLDGDAELYERAARFLALHTCTPLCDAPIWMEQVSGWNDGLGYASFGLTWLAWPGGTAQSHAAHRLAKDVWLLLLGSTNEGVDADALLREAALAPPFLAPRLTPPMATEAAHFGRNDLPSLSLGKLLRSGGDSEHPFVANLDAALAAKGDVLSDCALMWERRMQAGISEVIALARAWVARAADAGGLHQTRALIPALERRLGEWADGAEQRRIDLLADLPRMEHETQAVRDELLAVLNKLPRRNLKALIRLLRNPLRWVWLWLRWRKAQNLVARYVRGQAAMLETKLDAERMQRACGVYWALGSELLSISQELDRLEHRLRDALGLSDELSAWPDSLSQLESDPDILLDQLAERYLPSPEAVAEGLLAQLGPLSHWWTDGGPDKDTVREWLMQETEILSQISIWEVIRCRYAQAEIVHAWLDEMIAQSAPLWRWDPVAISDVERARTGHTIALLSPPDQDVSEGSAGHDVRVIPLARDDWLAVVSLRWGVPADAGVQLFERTGSRDEPLGVEVHHGSV